MEFAIAAVFIALLAGALTLNVLSLPANWVVLVLLGLWKLLHPAPTGMDTMFFVIVIGAALVGEVLEFLTQTVGAKRYGSTGKGNLGGIIGAIAGALLGAPFLFGLGALFGALGGAWAGCYLLEIGHGRSRSEAAQAAKGAMMGRFLGLVLKTGIGAGMVIYAAPRIWPG